MPSPGLRLEIFQQPDVLATFLDQELAAVSRVASFLRRKGFRQVVITARGSSENAAIYGKYLFGTLNRLPVALAAPSLYTLYKMPPDIGSTLVLGISQSGESPDIVEVIEEANRQGATTVAITNAPDSPLAKAAHDAMFCQAGDERSVAATKTYTAQLMALALLAACLADDRLKIEELRRVPGIVARALDLEGDTKQVAQCQSEMNQCIVISRGYNYATALEVALKLSELSYAMAHAYSAADFLHGPVAMVAPDLPLWLVAVSGPTLRGLSSLAAQLRNKQADMIVVSDSEEALQFAERPLPLPHGLSEWFSPIVTVIPGQLFAYHLALLKGHDPERPRGLEKVTLTW